LFTSQHAVQAVTRADLAILFFVLLLYYNSKSTVSREGKEKQAEEEEC
jgi:hypothetical protein